MLRKIFTILMCLFMVAGSVIPQNSKQVYALENEITEVNKINEASENVERNNLPTMIDSNYDISNVEIEAEEISMRTATSKTFRKIDGSYIMAVYNSNVHYEKDGELVEIDNSLNLDTKSSQYENISNKFKIKFPTEIDDNKKFKVKLDDYEINWSVDNIRKTDITYIEEINKSNNIKELDNIIQEVLYKNIQQNVSLQYILDGADIKENIILEDYIENYSITFSYKVKNLKLEKDSTGLFVFVNELGQEIFYMSPFYMFDINGNSSKDISVQVIETKTDEYKVTITPNDFYLKNASFPVIIDPTITYNRTDTLIRDKYVEGSNSYDTNFLKVGNNGTNINRSYLEFDIDKLPDNSQINYAHLYFEPYISGNNSASNFTIVAKEVFSSVEYDDINSEGLDITYSRELDFENIYYSQGYNFEYMFDITSCMQRWNNSTISHRTIEVRTLDETLNDYIEFDSINSGNTMSPLVEIGYTNKYGIKDYWTYNSQDLGLVGTGFVSDFTGELTFLRSDINFETDLQSLGVSFAYSSGNEMEGNIYGKGWNVNYNLYLEYDSSLTKYFTTDFTGDVVYYISTTEDDRVEKETGHTYECFVSEDGSRKLLVIDYNTVNHDYKYYILDSKGDKYIFSGYNSYLTRISYADSSTHIEIVRPSSNSPKISYVRDTSYNYLRFYYDTNNKLTSILLRTMYIDLSDEDQTMGYYLEKVAFNYRTNEELANVSYYSNYSQDHTNDIDNTITYNYCDNKLIEGYISGGEKIIYTYMNSVSSKVEGIESYYNNVKFSEVSYEYNNKETIISDHTNNFVIYKFDDYGHTVNIIDKKTNTVNYNYIDIFNNPDVNIHNNYFRNHEVIKESIPQKITYNLVENYSFEIGNHDDWITSVDLPSAYRSNTEYIGDYSLGTSDSNHAGGYVYQEIILDEGVYSFRASIKNLSTYDKGAYIQTQGLSSETVLNTGEWVNVNVPIYVSKDGTVVKLSLYNESWGTVLFDNISIIDGINDSRINLVENASFEKNPSTSWSWNSSYMTWYSVNDGEGSLDNTFEDILGEYAVGIKGSPTIKRRIYTDIDRSYFDELGNGGNFYIGAWANTYLSPYTGNSNLDNDKVFRIKVEFIDTNNSINKTEYIEFDQSVKSWQYVCEEIDSTGLDYDFVRISFEYKGINEVLFDGLTVFFEATNKIYNYDDLGRLINITWDDGKEYNFIYSSDEDTYPESVEDESGYDVMELNADGSELQYVEKNNVKTTPTYNDYGQVTSMSVEGYTSTNTLKEYFTTSTTYIWDSQYLETYKDEFNNTTTYQTDRFTGLLEHIENAKDVKTQYEYYDNGLLYHVYIGESSESAPYVKYVYDEQYRLIKIELDTDYYYEINYDDEGRMSNVKVNNNTLMSYSYLDNIIDLINEDVFINNAITEATGEIHISGNYSTVTYNEETIELETHSAYVDPNFGGYIEVNPNTEYTVSADILNITGTVKFNVFEYSGDPSTSTYIRVLKSSNTSSSGGLSYTFTTSSTTNHIIISFCSSAHYTMEFRDLVLDKVDDISTGILSTQTYSNGDSISFIYNDDNQVEYIRFTDSLGNEVTRFHYMYDSYGRVSVYEDLLNQTSETYEYDMKGRLVKVKYSNGDDILYGYDDLGNLASVVYNFGTISSETLYKFETGSEKDFYDFTQYDNGNQSIKRNYIYDDYGLRNLQEIQCLISGNSTSYFDLEFDYFNDTTRIDQITYNFTSSFYSDISYIYTYDSLGNILTETYTLDGVAKVYKTYTYDDYNQLIQEDSRDYDYDVKDYSSTNFSTYYTYDLNGNITSKETYKYGESENTQLTPPSFYFIDYSTLNLEMEYNVGKTYNDIYNLQVGQNPTFTFMYYYESSGGIGIQGLAGPGGGTTRTYIGLNTVELFSNLDVNHDGYYYTLYEASSSYARVRFRVVFKVGNPTNVSPVSSTSFEYDINATNDNGWKDQLDSYTILNDGVSSTSNITYDEQGNPTQISNFGYMDTIYDQATLTWFGRDLKNITISDNDLVTDIQIDYTYNDQGIRIKKVIQDPLGTTTYNYKLSGDTLVAEVVDNGYDPSTHSRNFDYTILYNYDYDGSLIGFSTYYNGTTTDYLYIKNLLGDITHIINTSGDVLVEYRYDAYGNIVDTIYDSNNTYSDNIAYANSFRYRSYKYDEETSYYYLQSRYYNPIISRFINSDGLLGEIGNLQSNNMYAYCANNPVMFTDSTGYWFGFDDVITGPVDEIIVLGLLAIAALVGVSGAADALDDLTNAIGNTLSNVADEIKQATKTISVAIVVTIASIRSKNVGAYVIQFSDGSYYVGKGSPARMYISAMREGLLHGEIPISFRYEACSNDREAYKREYIMMVDYGYYSGTTYMYNRIWSPGRTYYLIDYGELYSDDYFGR